MSRSCRAHSRLTNSIIVQTRVPVSRETMEEVGDGGRLHYRHTGGLQDIKRYKHNMYTYGLFMILKHYICLFLFELYYGEIIIVRFNLKNSTDFA